MFFPSYMPPPPHPVIRCVAVMGNCSQLFFNEIYQRSCISYFVDFYILVVGEKLNNILKIPHTGDIESLDQCG